ncbi:hypothetical protein BUM91_31495 [Bacillus thuringiensis]|nr:hypothetical protein BUM91_31495 [Bacillus thuringiensis]
MPYVWKVHRNFPLSPYHVEYKAIGMIQDQLFLLFQVAQKNSQAIAKIPIHLFALLKKSLEIP